MSEPLNIPLYNALARAFEDVQISGRGEQAEVRVTQAASILARGAGHRDRVESKGGEYYCVSCPFCDDTRLRRHRLWISYLYGRDVSVDGLVVQGTRRLAHCYNEDCLNDRDNRWRLWNMIRDNMVEDDSAPMDCAAEVAEREVSEEDLPQGCVSVRDPKCPAMVRDYLLGRGVDLIEAARDYGLLSGNIGIYAPYPAIVVPIRQGGSLRGWQARQVKKHPEHAPKYFFPPVCRKAWTLFNFDKASLSDFVIIVEGVFDVIRVGGPCVATFGHKMSPRQAEMILGVFRRVIVLPDNNDPEAWGIAQAYTSEWLQRGLVDSADVIRIPGDDPGSTPREDIWNAIEQHFKEKGE